ncbi:cAMP phosphodiesterase class-II [Biscogniauxia mediterranea]|nr:cAMP phosphodiesterase class-II [Biscogniauxia mediterranea]
MPGEVEGGESARSPALQVIVLGCGGGPQEHNVTALLVRSVKSGWARGSIVALDAGVHLSAIARILEETQPKGLGTDIALPHTLKTGPFAGLELPFTSPTANAGYITRQLIDTYLITHPHLDHISGFVINTAGFPGARPKRLAGLPSTIAAFKAHIFNNVIWPNLTDENNGAGLVTYTRLVEGGSPALGEGDGKGYLEVCDGLTVKIYSVSHGHCIERHAHRGSASSSRYGSLDASTMPSPRVTPGSIAASGPSALFRSSGMRHESVTQDREAYCVYDSSAYFIRDPATGREVLMFGDVEPDALSLSPRNFMVWQEAAPRIAKGNLAAIFIECSYDDSQSDDRLFGHLTPRYIIQEMKALAAEVELARHGVTTTIGATAAPTTTPTSAASTPLLHPRLEPNKKRKREAGETAGRRTNRAAARSAGGDDHPVSPKSMRPSRGTGLGLAGDYFGGFDTPQIATPHIATPTPDLDLILEDEFNDEPKRHRTRLHPHSHPYNYNDHRNEKDEGDDDDDDDGPPAIDALRGLKVVIIHVKEKLDDGEPARDVILRELREHETRAKLGCEFFVSGKGESFMF